MMTLSRWHWIQTIYFLYDNIRQASIVSCCLQKSKNNKKVSSRCFFTTPTTKVRTWGRKRPKHQQLTESPQSKSLFLQIRILSSQSSCVRYSVRVTVKVCRGESPAVWSGPCKAAAAHPAQALQLEPRPAQLHGTTQQTVPTHACISCSDGHRLRRIMLD